MNPRYSSPFENKTFEVKQKHVLVVDDDVDLAQSYKEMLLTNDYIVSVAHNGVEALKTVMHLDVDAIFCDMNMPTMAGDMFFTAVERVKPHLCKRFVFVTGYEGNPQYQEFFKRTKAIVLYKPVTLGKLLGTLNLMLSKAEGAAKK